MRFGIVHFTHGPVHEVVTLAKLAEEKQFDSYWISEVGLSRDLYIVLAFLAAQTNRVTLGAETNIYTRHPAITANALATLDDVSHRRAALILGSGHKGYLYQTGIHEHPKGTAVMKETIDICRRIWTGDRFNYDGVRFPIRNLQLGYEPPQNLPIIIAENNVRMLEVAGASADGAFINFTPLQYIPQVQGHIQKGLAQSNRNTSACRLYLQPLVAIAKDQATARKAVERTIFHSLSLAYSHDPLRQSMSIEKEELTPAFQAAMKELTTATDLDFATLNCAPIILKLLKREVLDRLLDNTTVYGTVDDVTEKLKKYEKAGIWEVDIGPAPYPNPYKADITDYIKIIGDEIIPHFNDS